MLIREDADTGVQLWAEQRDAPGGEHDILYRFKTDSPRWFPPHLKPSDATNRGAALVAFRAIVEWCKANPQG